MSINNNSTNINSLNEKCDNLHNYNNYFDKNIFNILEIESNTNFEIISNDINFYTNKINFQKDNLNYNIHDNGNNEINNFMTKLYNNNSILTINQTNLDEIFLVFKQIILSKINEYSTSIIIDINNFEIKYNNINSDDCQNNQNIGKEIVKNDIKNDTNIIDYGHNISRENEINNQCNININDNVINKNDSYKLLKLVKCYSFNEKAINNKSLFYNIFEKEGNDDSNIIKKSYSQDLNKYKNIFNEEKANSQYINNNINNNVNNNNVNNNNLNNEDNDKVFNDIENKIKIEAERANYEENNIIKDNGKTLKVESQLNNNENEKTKEKDQIYIDINENTLKNISNNINNINIKERDSLISSNKDKLISQKLKELDLETVKFREERNKIMKLKNDYEKLQKQLIEDIEEFQRKKEQFEKYKQNEMERLKKKKIYEIKNNFNINNNINNNKVLFNSKNDKEVIKLLKNQIKDLENIVKLKDCELRIYKNNKNPNIILKNNNRTTGKVYNNKI